MQHRHDPRRIEIALVDQERAQLRVAVLLDEEDLLVLEDEIHHLVAEREAAHPHRVEMDALGVRRRSSASCIDGAVEPK